MFSLVLYVALMLFLDSVVDEDHGKRFFESEREKERKQKENFRTLVTYSTGMADVVIPISSVLERYVLNAWKKFGVERIMRDKRGFVFINFFSSAGLEGVLEHGPWPIHSLPLILRKWTLTAGLSRWFECYCYSTWYSLDVGFVYCHCMLDGNGVMMHILRWNMSGNHQDVVMIGSKLGIEIFFCGPVTRKQEVKVDRNRPKKQQFIPVRTKTARGASTPFSNVFEVPGDLEDDGHLDALNARDPKRTMRYSGVTFSTLREDNGNFMEDLVDVTKKKMGAHPRKTM
uniref:DUF4283 domain-containing protein n=1 Tax=Tanacetum cinerariifolium TaxID=118510 RepID=A0A6L2LIN0_TANCI|nr:hypothetical protein [Tanacetum cinerariifolium]